MTARLAPTPELVWFTGPDAVKFLNDLISQEIAHLEPGSVTRSLLLGPQGKLDFILWVLIRDGGVGLVTEDGRGDELVARLSRYRIRVDVEIEPETRPVHLVVSEAETSVGELRVEGDSLRANLSWSNLKRELVVGDELDGLEEIGPEEYELARIEAGEPLMNVDVDENTIPQETDLVPSTVSFDKGCFLGQELVARLDSRGGRVNQHLRILDLDAGVERGAEIKSAERSVGELTSVSGTTGLARLWREVEPGDEVEVGGVTATVRALPQKTERSFTAS
jgi:folate-binding protein YgfZ